MWKLNCRWIPWDTLGKHDYGSQDDPVPRACFIKNYVTTYTVPGGPVGCGFNQMNNTTAVHGLVLSYGNGTPAT